MKSVGVWSAWGTLGAGVLLNLAVVLKPPVIVSPPGVERPPPSAGLTTTVQNVPRDSLARVLIRRDPFRIERRAAPGRYRVPPSPTPGLQAAAPKPSLRLVGIVGGGTPSAVLEGLPGTDGPRVVRAGDVIGRLSVVRITATEVRVSGLDTIWTLQMVAPWK